MGRVPDINDINYILANSSEDDALLLEMEEYARKNGVPILDKISSKFLEQLILLAKPENILEIGTAIGYTSIKLAAHLDKNACLDTVEVDATMYETAKRFISKAKRNSKINVIFEDAIKYLSDTNKTFDMIFLDCDKEIYPELFHIIVEKLNVGGVFIADNLLWHGYTAAKEVPEDKRISTEAIREFNNLFLTTEKLKSEILPIGDGIGLGIKMA